MIDIKQIRTNPEELAAKLAKKGFEADFTEFLAKDAQRRVLTSKNDGLRGEKKKLSGEFAKTKKDGGDVSEIEKKIKAADAEIAANEAELKELDVFIDGVLNTLPNPPPDDVVAGGKENNEVIRIFGEKPIFDFEMRDHMQLSELNGLIDYERGAKISGSGFWVYRGEAARLEWALLNYFVAEHISDGYEMLFLPHILLEKSGYTAGQFPKFAEDVFHVEGEAGAAAKSFLLPTAETALANLHRDEILKEEDLPLKYFAYTPCYRKEAGSYRKEERGMIRGHQFNKVELFQYAHPDKSEEALFEVLEKAERLVRGLGLHHRVSKLAAEDCSWGLGKTYDIEVWLPSMGIYKEVSSVSNAYEYQARRGNIRFRDANKELRHAHTLNGSGLATSRILPAILEQFQNPDGSVNIPSALRPYMGGQERVKIKK